MTDLERLLGSVIATQPGLTLGQLVDLPSVAAATVGGRRTTRALVSDALRSLSNAGKIEERRGQRGWFISWRT